ncbi:putative UPF0645 membrane protein C20H4.02 [Glarea lozoyensis 74030]|uniref:Putative UPF0645 membrane protein C20H4.02 n=1 Tax=Glarea lozoyensis (strain ATCC 74030 / MF5533) TaxID=1104152 RepID=H0ESQ8_GLAL7|nr:putative UPF0645 membrane protein C20H4.02 [Glarea lozoyensis 74030]
MDLPVRTANPLHLTIRFTTSIPDLLLDISEPERTTVVALKHLLRSRLDPPTSQHRLRFIQGGKLLQDGDVLHSVLKISTPPPRTFDPKGKGKEPELPAQRVYINCSIGDVLTADELSAEAAAAAQLTNRASTGTTNGSKSAAEVNQLRLQFLSIQSNIHTPETMPSPTTLRHMEDAWIDDNAGNTGTGGAAGGFDFGDDGLGGGALDDLLWGNVMGFLWPLGCLGWVLREEGVLSATAFCLKAGS